MKRVNKLLRILALVVVMCMMMATVAYAAETGKVWISVAESVNGKDTAAMILTDTTVTDGLVKVTYDPEALTYKSVLVSSEYVAMHSVNAEEAGVVLIAWVAPEAYEADGSTITLIEVRFEGVEETSSLEATGAAQDAEGNEIVIGTVDKSVLEETLAQAEEMKEEDYTEETWKALEDAKKAAEAVLEDPTATQEEVDEAAAALEEAIANLEECVDKSALEEALAKTEELKEEDYTEETWKALEKELKEAKKVLEDPKATQEQVDAAVAELEETIAELVKVADKSQLEKAIKDAESKTKKNYTKKSWDAMQAALKVAKKVMKDEDATQEEVDAATDALNKAIKALVPATGKNPETGDNAQPVLVAAIAAVALIGAAALIVLKKKKGGK